MDKYKRADVKGIERENERDKNYTPTKNPDIDLKRTGGNYNIVRRGCSYITYINQRIKELAQKRKIKDDAVLINSFILGSDKEFFEGLSPEEQRQFFTDCTEFFAERYGYENIISAVVHVDETSPHLHLNMIPVLDGRLCSKQLFDRVALRELQSDFHEAVGKKWGLQRGKEGSTAKHKPTAEYKAEIIKQAEQQAQEYLDGVHSSIVEAQNQPLPKKKKEVAEEITALRADNAAYKQQLEIKNRDSKDLFNLVQEQERKLRTSEKAYKMVTDIIETYPDEFEALLSKARQKKNPPTPFHGKRGGWSK